MVSVEDAVIARLSKGGRNFEVLVDSEKSLELRKGKSVSMDDILAVRQVFKDSKKGKKASDEDLKEEFETTDPLKIARQIIKQGDVQLTTRQKRKLTKEKRKQVASIISRRGINPQTDKPHPPKRIENAMEQAQVNIDPFTPAGEQVKDVLEKIRPIVPISFQQAQIAVKVPVKFAGKASSEIRRIAEVKKEEWKSTHWFALLEIPAGMQTEIYNKLNELTSGNVETKVVKKKEL